ncbi:MAG: hypothetical protein OXH10_01050 [bacterium]|nr:hypothetical protein [bacterium]MCY3579232.1 hypothetical protein [bacterium]MCY3652624.1 hypothetical protein [bacterium]MDE0643241.1 hypothetical protein [bacterium]
MSLATTSASSAVGCAVGELLMEFADSGVGGLPEAEQFRVSGG